MSKLVNFGESVAYSSFDALGAVRRFKFNFLRPGVQLQRALGIDIMREALLLLHLVASTRAATVEVGAGGGDDPKVTFHETTHSNVRAELESTAAVPLSLKVAASSGTTPTAAISIAPSGQVSVSTLSASTDVVVNGVSFNALEARVRGLENTTVYGSCEDAYIKGETTSSFRTTVAGYTPTSNDNAGHTSPPGALYTLANGVTTQCIFENGHGWTLVYKLSRASSMMGTTAIATDKLQLQFNVNEVGGGKMHDSDIRQLCTKQFKVVQGIANAADIKGVRYCAFQNPSLYRDDSNNAKGCSGTYSPSHNYPTTSGTWLSGFSHVSAGIIVQGAYNSDGSGSGSIHTGSPPVDGVGLHSCTSTGGCAIEVWCLGGVVDPQIA